MNKKHTVYTVIPGGSLHSGFSGGMSTIFPFGMCWMSFACGGSLSRGGVWGSTASGGGVWGSADSGGGVWGSRISSGGGIVSGGDCGLGSGSAVV